MNLLQRLRRPSEHPGRSTTLSGILPSWPTTSTKGLDHTFTGYTQEGYYGNAIVFALIGVRANIFSEATFKFRTLDGSKNLFGNPDLSIVELPWPNGTTGELLTRMEQDISLGGNSYWLRQGDSLIRLQPDLVDIIHDEVAPIAYKFHREGRYSSNRAVIYLPEEIIHYAPIPDPLAKFRGMSWLTPVAREIVADGQMTRHKQKFFDQAAAQPLDAQVLTPSGWRLMRDITVGGEIVGSDGKARQVLGVYPQGVKDVYRLTFSDGSQAESCEDHIWNVATVADRNAGTSRNLTLRQIIDKGVKYPSGPAKWSIPLTDPVEYDDPGPLPLDPYLLGALLGDGSFRGNGKGSGGISFSSHLDDADEMEERLAALLPEGVTISRWDRHRDSGGCSVFYFKGSGGPRENPLTKTIKSLGLFDVIGYDKFIPQAYLQASVTDRIALLQGLIDTDGSVNRSPSCSSGVRFINTSERLARQVQELAQSLGAVASIRQVRPRIDKPQNRPQWVVRISRLPEWIFPVRLQRKRTGYRSTIRGNTNRHRYLQSVELVCRAEVQCIKVDASDGLYLTNGFIVTHNSPNLLLTTSQVLSDEEHQRVMSTLSSRHEGVENAYRTLFLEGGVTATAIGNTFEEMSFATVQAAGENRIAAAAGVPGIVAGLKEGLSAATYSNFQQARRRFVDITIRPLWREMCASVATVVKVPSGSQLWYDDQDIAALQDNALDKAQVAYTKAKTIQQLIQAGYEPDQVANVVESGRGFTGLKHTGLVPTMLYPSTDEDVESSQPSETE